MEGLEERHNMLVLMADLSKEIKWNREQIGFAKVEIKKINDDIVKRQKSIDDAEINLLHLMEQLRNEFQE